MHLCEPLMLTHCMFPHHFPVLKMFIQLVFYKFGLTSFLLLYYFHNYLQVLVNLFMVQLFRNWVG